jgi:hypothetical protein
VGSDSHGCTAADHAALKADAAAWAKLPACGYQGNLELRTCPLCGSTIARLDRGKVQRELLAITDDLAEISAEIVDDAAGHMGGSWQVAGIRNAAGNIGSAIRVLGMTLDEAQADYERTAREQAERLGRANREAP